MEYNNQEVILAKNGKIQTLDFIGYDGYHPGK
jgi:hypothetical protein